MAGGVQDPECERLEEQGDLRPDQELAAVHTVGERTGGQGEEENGEARHRVDDAEVGLGVVEGVDDERERIGLHPCADVADERTAPEEPVVPDAERAERAARAHGPGRRPLDVGLVTRDRLRHAGGAVPRGAVVGIGGRRRGRVV